jgi:hypothetical protein
MHIGVYACATACACFRTEGQEEAHGDEGQDQLHEE